MPVTKEQADVHVKKGTPGTPSPDFQISSEQPLTHDEIAQLAYELWQARGCPHGSAEVDWLRAEEELARQVIQKKSGPVQPPFLRKLDGVTPAPRAAARSRSSLS